MDKREVPGALFLLGFFPFFFILMIYSALKDGYTEGFLIVIGILVAGWALFVVTAFKPKWVDKWVQPSSEISDQQSEHVKGIRSSFSLYVLLC